MIADGKRGKLTKAHPKISITPWEAQLVFSDGKTAGEKPDLNGNLPLVPAMPTRRRVSIEEFEAGRAALQGKDSNNG